MKDRLVIAYRLGFALLAGAAVVAQFEHSTSIGFSAVNFFSFFTIESNIFAVVMLLASCSAVLGDTKSGRLEAFRGAATLYMVVTGLVYVLLLSGNEAALQTTIPWVNTVLHYVLPVVMLLDWLIVPPARRLPRAVLGYWLIFPVTYLVYSLIRGPYVQWYPYPFVNPEMVGGYGAVAGYALCIAACVLIIAWALWSMGNRLSEDAR